MSAAPVTVPQPERGPLVWAKVVDHTRCIGCHACSTACKSENQVPLGVNRTYVKYVDVGRFPDARRAFQVTRCNQCDDAPCTAACPTAAMYRRRDGIVDFDKSICIGCKACIAACPYDAIFINPDDGFAEKCNFCAHRLDVGLEPACVVVCPTEAIVVGDLNDPSSRVSRYVQRDAVTVRRPEKETKPKLFYKGAHQATLDPIAARRPDGGLFMWSVQAERGAKKVVSGHPGAWNSSAAALVSYDVSHVAPWGWKVSLYTWTKSIAAGVWLVPALLLILGWIDAATLLWRWLAPFAALGALALTGLLLIADLKHPERFFFIFTRPQWKSWLVRGALGLTAYTVLLLLHLMASWLDLQVVAVPLAVVGLPIAVLAAIYTAYLFAQAKGRDLWQSPLLAPHLLVQALLAGAALLASAAAFVEPQVEEWLLGATAWMAAAHLLLVGAEATLGHPTAHARLAVWEMTSGRYFTWFVTSVVFVAAGVFAPLAGSWVAGAALIGLACYEHAYVQAGQAVPLA